MEINLIDKQKIKNRISDSVKKQYKLHCEKNLPYGFKDDNYSIKTDKKLNERCFKLYENSCFVCNTSKSKLFIHHINGIHEDNRIENIAPICNSCHQKLHKWWKGWILKLQTDIDYGHHMPNHEGKCYYSHGHTAIIKVKFQGLIKKDGMVADFKDLKTMIKDVVEPLDHSYVNELESNPSAEKLASFIFNQIEIELHHMRIKQKRIIWLKELDMSEGLNKSVIII